MSEHISVKGKIEYLHWATLLTDEFHRFTGCRKCGTQANKKMIIELHEGCACVWLRAVCGECGKTIWTARLDDLSSDDDYQKGSDINLRYDKTDKICCVCGGPTSYRDAVCVSFNGDREYYYCSDECREKELVE